MDNLCVAFATKENFLFTEMPSFFGKENDTYPKFGSIEEIVISNLQIYTKANTTVQKTHLLIGTLGFELRSIWEPLLEIEKEISTIYGYSEFKISEGFWLVEDMTVQELIDEVKAMLPTLH